MNNFKQEYIKIRNSQKYPIEWFYRYFVENGGANIDLQSFHSLFSLVDLNSVLSFLDSKFELTRLEDSNGKFIKIVE